MRTPIVAGNWKMNGDRASVELLLKEIQAELAKESLHRCQVLVFPPYVYLPLVSQLLEASEISIGAQEVDARENGAITGGVSVAMIRDTGCEFSLVGHSERRTLFAETDEATAGKCDACVTQGVTPILCVGETLEERKRGETRAVVERQLSAVVARLGKERLSRVILAYEPVWAIGTGESATPEQADEVHGWLREAVAREDVSLSESIQILYGGSVTPDNAGALFGMKNIDGALVGGASLKGKSFVDICRAAEES